MGSNGRLQGRLEVSRAFGDSQFKKVLLLTRFFSLVKIMILSFAVYHILATSFIWLLRFYFSLILNMYCFCPLNDGECDAGGRGCYSRY